MLVASGMPSTVRVDKEYSSLTWMSLAWMSSLARLLANDGKRICDCDGNRCRPVLKVGVRGRPQFVTLLPAQVVDTCSPRRIPTSEFGYVRRYVLGQTQAGQILIPNVICGNINKKATRHCHTSLSTLRISQPFIRPGGYQPQDSDTGLFTARTMRISSSARL